MTEYSKNGVPLSGREACRTGWDSSANPFFFLNPRWFTWWTEYRDEQEKMWQEHLRGCEDAARDLGVDSVETS